MRKARTNEVIIYQLSFSGTCRAGTQHRTGLRVPDSQHCFLSQPTSLQATREGYSIAVMSKVFHATSRGLRPQSLSQLALL